MKRFDIYSFIKNYAKEQAGYDFQYGLNVGKPRLTDSGYANILNLRKIDLIDVDIDNNSRTYKVSIVIIDTQARSERSSSNINKVCCYIEDEIVEIMSQLDQYNSDSISDVAIFSASMYAITSIAPVSIYDLSVRSEFNIKICYANKSQM